MSSKSTPSFIVEIPLHTSSKEEMVLRKRFWATKQQYNALLREALKRLDGMRKDKAYKEASFDYKQKETRSQVKETFKLLAKEYGFREYDLYGYCKQWNKKKGALRIGARISQKLAKRVFDAVEKYKNKLRGRPRFKGYKGVNSIEDNSIDANLRLKEGCIHYLGISMKLLWDPKDPIHFHGMNSKHKYVRLVRRRFGAKIRYFAQIVCEGTPWVKSNNMASDSVVRLDIGPQTIALVSPSKKKAALHVFADQLKDHKKLHT